MDVLLRCDVIMRRLLLLLMMLRGNHGVVHGNRNNLLSVKVSESAWRSILLHLIQSCVGNRVHVIQTVQIRQIIVISGLVRREFIQRSSPSVHEEVGDGRDLQLELFSDGGLHILRRSFRFAKYRHQRATLYVGENQARFLGARCFVLDHIFFAFAC